MTDNDIIKALECCVNEHEDCENCPVFDFCKDNSHEMVKETLALINRQKAEIEALRMDNQQLQSDIANANMNADHALAEVERLQTELYLAKYTDVAKKKIKAEAIKEFLDKASGFVVVNVPVSMFNLEYGKDVELFSDVIRVKHLLKIYQEMVGDDGGSSEKVQMAGDRI